MSDFYVVVDSLNDWLPYYSSQDVITFDHYVAHVQSSGKKRIRVINLCRNYRYLGTGYYCSLLAEARGHNVFPSVNTISDLDRKALSSIYLDESSQLAMRLPAAENETTMTFRSWFGKTLDPLYAKIAHKIFQKFPCPLLEITLDFKKTWKIKKVKAISLKELEGDAEQEAFAKTFERFSLQMWRKSKAKKSYRYDIAILVNPEDPLPPSDEQALKLFQKAAHQLGIGTELITRKDYMRLAEFDGLFIRETTSVQNHTYQFAKKAEAEGLVVIDDPLSILRCTNKVYLADLLKTNKIPTPATHIIQKLNNETIALLENDIGYPMVLKVPDGAFSRGVVKVEDQTALLTEGKALLKESAMLLVQEFMYTEYDWRVGILNNKPLYACRYYMVNNHWQIYKHDGNQESQSGDFDTLPTFEAPKNVIDTAMKAAKLIGEGFYGVDLKQSGDRVVIIEVNDNPSIDSEVEDKYLGEALYTEIMKHMLERMENSGR